jgi:hypothetical protein
VVLKQNGSGAPAGGYAGVPTVFLQHTRVSSGGLAREQEDLEVRGGPRNLVTVELFSSLILFATGIHFPPVLLHNQGYRKVCPDPLNLPNAGDPFAGTSSSSSYSLFSPTRDLIALI